MVGYIYSITSPSGRIYIGQTINPERRVWQYSKGKCESQIKLKNSINKYGWHSHTFKVIEELQVEYLDNREVELIRELDTMNIGLNCLPGGSNGRRGISHTKESKLKMKVAQTGKDHSHYIKGNRVSNKRPPKPVLCIETGVTYESVKQAAEALNLSKGNISSLCTGKLPHTGKLTFKHIN